MEKVSEIEEELKSNKGSKWQKMKQNLPTV
jgi:hypothetical protein